MAATLQATQNNTVEHRLSHIWVGTHETNKRAINAYKKAGFIRFGRRTFRVGDVDNTDVTLVRELNLAE